MLNLDGGVDTHTPMGSVVFTVVAALAPMEPVMTCERLTDLVATCSAAGRELGG